MFKRIRDLREDSDYTQAQIGKKLNMSQSQYQKYESGIRTPPIDILIALAEIYDVSVDYLLGRTNYKKLVQSDMISSKNCRLTEYYNRLSTEDQDFIIGKMVELYKEYKQTQKENVKKRNV